MGLERGSKEVRITLRGVGVFFSRGGGVMTAEIGFSQTRLRVFKS